MFQIRRVISGMCVMLGLSAMASAQHVMYIHQHSGYVPGAETSGIDSVMFDTSGSSFRMAVSDTVYTQAVSEVDSLSFAASSRVVRVEYDGTTARVYNPLAFEGVDVRVTGAEVEVRATIDEEVEYRLSGTATDGTFKIYSDKKLKLVLDGVSITHADGPAINIQTGKKISVELADGTVNTLVDGTSYTACGEEDMKGTFFSEGQLVFEGAGTLQVTGNKKHGICSDDYIRIDEGNFVLTKVASDAFRANDYIEINGGTFEVAASGDAFDGDEGYITINGGTLHITVAEDTQKGIKCDSTIALMGGDILIETSGHVVLEDNDPSYCTAVKTDHDLTIDGCNLTIVSTGEAGKGISIDGNLYLLSGNVNIKTSGGGAKYTNTDGEADSYSATCIKADGDILVGDVVLTLESTGAAGKGMSADGAIVIGNEIYLSPVVNVKTSGAKFLVSGSGQDADYANPKAVKADGNLTVNAGTIHITSTQDGGEGLESKDSLVINGGLIEISTVDDCINGKTHVAFHGGQVYCYASGNDAIDSNGTLAMTGGVVVAQGASAPEGGIDCDNSQFVVSGGVLIAMGGSNSKPTTNVSSQPSVLYSASGLSGKVMQVCDASGNDVLTFRFPSAGTSNSLSVLFTTGGLTLQSSYTIYTGGTLSGGTEFHGYVTGATCSGGSQAATFTASSMLTTVGSSGGGSGGFPGGGRP